MADEIVLPIPNLTVPQKVFVLSNPKLHLLHGNARKELLEAIKADGVYTFQSKQLCLIVCNRRNGALLQERHRLFVSASS